MALSYRSRDILRRANANDRIAGGVSGSGAGWGGVKRGREEDEDEDKDDGAPPVKKFAGMTLKE